MLIDVSVGQTTGAFSSVGLEPRAVNSEWLVDEYGDLLRSVGDDVHDARAAFLQERCDGYVEDTYLVRDVGYVCWPAISAGSFEAYDDLLDAELDALGPLEREGFERLGDGLSSVVLTTPPNAGDTVVKLGRCGMGGGFGDGRTANLVEAALSAVVGSDAPIVPSVHCSPRGVYAVYPLVRQADELPGERRESGPETGHEGTVSEVRRWLSDRAPWLDLDEAVARENLCVWRDRLRTLDYSHPDDQAAPLGVPDHVDGSAVVNRVDERRRSGDKRDLVDGGGYANPGDG